MTPLFSTPLCAAPMAGITDKPFRHMMRRFGAHTLYTEMIGAESFVHGHPVTVKMMHLGDESNVIVQIVGADAVSLAQTARAAEAAGALGVNINMGCPVKKLIANRSGAALMKYPDQAAALVAAVKAAVSIPVSVKIRAGWDNAQLNAPAFARVLTDAGADGIIVHGRTQAQGYAGTNNPAVIAAVKAAVSIPVFANGDVRDKAGAEHMLYHTNADGVMVGRACLGRPWILAEIETGHRPVFSLGEVVETHFDALLSYYGQAGVFIARKHLAWYAAGQADAAAFCQAVFQCDKAPKIKQLIHDFFNDRGNI